MGRQYEGWLAGEVHCLNCGAALTEVASVENGIAKLRPARFQRSLQVVVEGPHSLRCRRCGGRALVDLFDDPTEEIQAAARGKQYVLA